MTDGTKKWNPIVPLAIGFVALFVLIFGLGAWSALANISGAIVSSGMIIVEGNRQAVQHPEGGVVGEILVEEGQSVESGDLLLRLDGRMVRSELAIIESQLFEIMARRARLEAERDGADVLRFDPELIELANTRTEILELMLGQERLFRARQDSRQKEVEQLSEQKVQIGNQIEGSQAQLAALKDQLAFIEEELTDQRSLLEKGLTQATRVLSLQREKSRLGGLVGELTSQAAGLAARTTEIEIGILKLDTSLREQAISELRDIQYREIELKERRLSSRETLSRLDVKAPVAGVIYGRQINTIGAVIRPADVIMYIVPQDIPLVISTRIDSINIDEVAVGQEAALRFSAFDQRTSPEIYGYVSKVSGDAFVDENTGYTYYQAEILPKEGEVERLGDITLVPGMPVESFIKTGERTALNYLVKPLADYFNKAFRES
ncbi:HlyD family type I secretion periplasmic adaptor subunit [Algicella marina]|uniref:Membrane fusion protein (MFP) family protein n=1 Tax=Algicella marina TaxID=2683284 RepID=A0A6P1T0N6_9RHOB|nr:HlyD family type I secretion periplasmic adaptor subunit [Algicella marina]QHQ36474.1 HlyD family type I secretion periplasmic adaptor subunit [Algicella marina]